MYIIPKHYRGGLYQVLGIAQNTEDDAYVVVYVALTGADLPGPRMRVRPLDGKDGFLTPVDCGDGSHVIRFEYVGYETGAQNL